MPGIKSEFIETSSSAFVVVWLNLVNSNFDSDLFVARITLNSTKFDEKNLLTKNIWPGALRFTYL